MRLANRISFVAALVFLLALTGFAGGQWISGRQFVREQLAATAQEAATALALALTAALRDGDAALVRTTLLPVFDRGHYRRIAVLDQAGTTVDSITGNDAAAVAPDWFAALAGLDAPRAKALVNAGWQQVGRVEVEAEPRFALQQLWRASMNGLLWLVVAFAAAWLLMQAVLRRLLAPMAAVERIAGAAAQRRIAPIELQTSIREVARFVAGFNRLANLVNARLSEEENRAERFRLEGMTDRLTGMSNRHGLERRFQALEEPAWLGLLSVGGVEAVNRSAGYESGDAYLAAMAACVRDAFPGGDLARLRGGDFAIISTQLDETGLRREATRLLAELDRRAPGFEAGSRAAVAAWIPVDAGDRLAEHLATLDRIVVDSLDCPAERLKVFRHAPDNAGPETLETLRRCRELLAAGSVSLALQPVLSIPGRRIVQHEVFIRLRAPDGSILPAQRFLPLLQRDGQMTLVDRAMFKALRRAVARGDVPGGTLAVNLSADALETGGVPDWLATTLAHWPESHPLVIELREPDIVAAPIEAASLTAALATYGVTVAIDRFGTSPGGIAALRSLLPRYVKLDASLSRGLEAVERRFQIESLVRAAHVLEVPVWAQVFERAGALEVLAEMGVVGAQGYALAAELEVAGR
jgi:EAL domain-containing protein (putative c-di-GMP-specific phosphodiesterase class I)/GGDEF domain-containing protein